MHWSERKEGLLGLQVLFKHSSKTLNPHELTKVTDIFTKMLLDPHTKVKLFIIVFAFIVSHFLPLFF